jgi:hypothetical protein
LGRKRRWDEHANAVVVSLIIQTRHINASAVVAERDFKFSVRDPFRWRAERSARLPERRFDDGSPPCSASLHA